MSSETTNGAMSREQATVGMGSAFLVVLGGVAL